MSDPGSLKAAEQEAALQARLTAREDKLAGLKASLSDRKRALLGKLVESRAGAAPRLSQTATRPIDLKVAGSHSASVMS